MKVLSAVKAVCLTLTLVMGQSAIADTISGKLEFTKKPPFAGVIYVAGSGSSEKKPAIDQKGKAFTTKIAVGVPNEMIDFINSDTFNHNIYANDKKQNVKFDVGLMTPDNATQIKIDWPNETLVRVGCKIHPKMRSYIANIKSDHFQALSFEKKVKNYDISIKQVPGDKHQVVLLMPKYDKLTVELKKGESKTVEITRKGKPRGSLTLTRS